MSTRTATPTLRLRSVTVTYAGGARAAADISLTVEAGECMALVGESGCGKTTLARSVLGLLPPTAVVTGSVQVRGVEVVGADRRTLRRLRGLVVGYVPQDPFAACDPLRRVSHHVSEAWLAHRCRPPDGAVTERLEGLGIPDGADRARQRPHQWSGGMLQRATIAAATAHDPILTVADEPTSALDADRAAGIVTALRAAARTLLLCSHDLALVAAHADRVAVCYAGRIVEVGDARTIFERPRHPYTVALLASVPRPGHGLPEPLAGAPPPLASRPAGCAFAPRCGRVLGRCHLESPPLEDGTACWAVNP